MNHEPLPPEDIDEVKGLVFCGRCGRLLASALGGRRAVADRPCSPTPSAFRW